MRRQRFLAAVCSGALLGASLLSPVLWPFVVIGAALAFIVFAHAVTHKEAFVLGLITGTVKTAIALGWFWNAYPLDWLELERGFVQLLIIALYWVPAAITIGSGIGVVSYVYWRYVRLWGLWQRMLAACILWPLGEVVGAIIFSIGSLGPGSSVSAAFSFGFTGYALVSHTGALQLFGPLGVYGLSGVVGVLGVSTAYVVEGRRLRQGCVYGALILISGLVPFAEHDTPRDTPSSHSRVAVVETDFTQTSSHHYSFGSEARTDVYGAAIASAASAGADTVILPEESRFNNAFSSHDEVFAYIHNQASSTITVIDSSRNTRDDASHVTAYVYDTETQQLYTSDKQYLVPQGEYIPYIYGFFIKYLMGEALFERIASDTDYRSGIPPADTEIPPSMPSILFCSEVLDPKGVEKWLTHRENSPSYVAHIVSHSWFQRQPEILWNQLDAMLKLQARANGVAIAMAANEATAAFYVPNGEKIVPPPIAEGEKWRVRVYEF